MGRRNRSVGYWGDTGLGLINDIVNEFTTSCNSYDGWLWDLRSTPISIEMSLEIGHSSILGIAVSTDLHPGGLFQGLPLHF